MKPLVSIIIVNYNTRILLEDCLSSIDEHVTGVSYEVIVVDNASSDGSAQMVQSHFPEVRLIMTLNKADLVKSVMEKVHLKNRERSRQQYLFPELNYTLMGRKQATELVDSVLEIIKTTLEKGDHVLISGFGKFHVKFKWARRGRNPRTGEKILLKSRRIVAFRGSSTLKDKINNVHE